MKIKELVADYGETEVSQEVLDKLGIKAKKNNWKPQINERYWCVYSNGIPSSLIWGNDGYDNFCYNTCNCFKTQEEAEFHKQELLVEGELKLFAEEHNECELDWNDYEQPKYRFFYVYYRNQFLVDSAKRCKDRNVYFTSKEIALQAINEIGEDRLKKYYFGVKEGKLK